MRKIVLTLLLCVLVAGCMLAFAACGTEDGPVATDAATVPATTASATESATTASATEPGTAAATDPATDPATESATDAATTALQIDVTPGIRMVGGATITFSSSTGLRYSGFVDKADLDALTAAYGSDRVKVGMLVTPTENLTANSLDFTMEALDACDAITGEKYTKIRTTLTESSSGDTYSIAAVLSGIEKKDYAVSYSAVFYVEVNGKAVCYSTYLPSSATSLSDVAEKVLWDLSDTKVSKYRNEIEIATGVVRYSPYTPAQREQLMAICHPYTFTVMSYNIAVYDSPSGGAGWEGRDPAKVAETILSESPDIIGFQEVNQKGDEGWDATLAALAEEGGYTRLEGRYTKDNFEKNEIFFKTDMFTLKSEATLYFKQVASDLELKNTEKANLTLDKHDRSFHYAVLEHKESGRTILFVNTHLHYGGTGSGHEEDDKVRRYEIRAMLAYLEAMAKNYPDQIISGDMNAHYNSALPNNGGTLNMKVFFDGGFERTMDTAIIKGDVQGTLASGNRSARDTRYTFDYVLTKGNFATLFYTVVDNPIDVGSSYPSDHIPVMAEISLK